ncbi:hypothetical protein [Streptomyces alboverticillatus]|uniref:hypothetical protein n=1 Tax=Streptomyces TaxID=1883 RepID=UPI003CCBB4E4
MAVGKHQQTADARLKALRASPAEVRDRPAIRSVATDLIDRHARTPGARERSAAVRISVAVRWNSSKAQW